MRSGWRRTTLGEIAEIIGGGTPKTSIDEYWGGPIPWITPTEVTASEGSVISTTARTLTRDGLANSGARLLPVGSVLLTSRATIGAVALAGVEMATNQGFASLVAGPAVLPAYLMYWCQAHRADFVGRAGGNTFLEVSKTNVKTVPIDVPPLAEQGRIVDLVNGLDGVGHTIDGLSLASARAADALIENLIFVASAEEGWPNRTLRELGRDRSLIGGPFGSSLVRADYLDDGVPVIRGTNLSTGTRWVGGDFVFVSPGKADALARNLALPGDVIFTQRGTLGQVAIVPPTYERFVVSQSQMRMRVAPDKALAEYIYFAFRSPRLISAIEDRKIATANPHINLGILAELTVPVPDMERQRAIVGCLVAMEEQGEMVAANASALDRARSAILADLLSGEHEIPESYDRLLAPA
ncbi:MAG: restriction endonuclease subunit S [Acidimicrobiia bacterium]